MLRASGGLDLAKVRAACNKSPNEGNSLIAALLLAALKPRKPGSEHARFWALYVQLLPRPHEVTSLLLWDRQSLAHLQVRILQLLSVVHTHRSSASHVVHSFEWPLPSESQMAAGSKTVLPAVMIPWLKPHLQLTLSSSFSGNASIR